MTTVRNDGGPAFPLKRDDIRNGMSLRDWFAGKALNGMLAAGDDACENYAEAAHYAYCYADAMLAERSKATLTAGEQVGVE